MIVYVSAGNSDDKLSQAEWSAFIRDIEHSLPSGGWVRRHGNWRSLPDDPWQNACWCVEINDAVAETSTVAMKKQLAFIATSWNQDSIAWAEVKETEFLGRDLLNAS